MKTYLTQEDFETAKANGISYMTAYNRFYSYGWDAERAVTEPTHTYAKQKLWPRFKDLATEHGICQQTFYNRMRYRGMTPKKAATTPLEKPKYTGKRILNDELIQRAADNGISLNTLKRRVYTYYWDAERAVTTPINIQRRRKDLR